MNPPQRNASPPHKGAAERDGDAALVRRMADGDGQALGVLYDRHAGLVMAVCLRLLGDRPRAEETVIDVFDEMWRRSGAFDATRSSPRTYLVLLARSRSIDRLRSARGEPKRQSLDAASQASPRVEPPPATAQRREEADRVRRALAELEPQQREAIDAAFFDGLSHMEVATKLNRPLGTVKTHIRQALATLRAVLARDGEDARTTTRTTRGTRA